VYLVPLDEIAGTEGRLRLGHVIAARGDCRMHDRDQRSV
jgi:hypothetical protein